MKKAVRKKNNKRQVCSDVESTNRCLLKSIELPEAFWCGTCIQGLGDIRAWVLRGRPLLTFSESSRKG